MSNITRSEAIKTLKEHLSHWERLLQEHICEEQEGIDTISALKLAIASLETDEAYQLEYEPTTKNDLGVDAVSRADARSLICKIDIKHHLSGMSRKAFKDLYNGIDELPSVTPQVPKAGHWIGHREHCENLGVIPSGLGAYEWCSNCDCGIDVREWHRNHYNYCPNCGADMKSEDKE